MNSLTWFLYDQILKYRVNKIIIQCNLHYAYSCLDMQKRDCDIILGDYFKNYKIVHFTPNFLNLDDCVTCLFRIKRAHIQYLTEALNYGNHSYKKKVVLFIFKIYCIAICTFILNHSTKVFYLGQKFRHNNHRLILNTFFR
jgi:hypothetical protein